MENLVILIDKLPTLFLYVFPGLIGIYIYKYCTMQHFSDATSILWGMALSYTTLTTLMFITGMTLEEIDIAKTAIACTIISVVIGYLLARLWRSTWFDTLMQYCFGLTPQDDAISGVIDWQRGTNVELHFKDRDYWVLGHVSTIDSDTNGWICVKSPIKYDQNNNIIESFENKDNIFGAYPLSAIEHIKIVN